MMDAAPQTFEEIHFTARDGLKLYGRRYRPAGTAAGRPVLCLAGLTRNSRDFHGLAQALARTPDDPRTVYTFDYRGRGHSDFDPDWRNYALPIEMLDVQDFMTLTGLQRAAAIGTSRGGLITMVLAAAQPNAIGAAVLNDIGPVVERDGLSRIAGYVGRTPLPTSWVDATRLVRDLGKRQFPDLGDEDWEAIARALFNEKNGRPVSGYDRKLSNALSVLDGPMPKLWPQFEALKHVPVMVVRGELSDILTAETVKEMGRRHPRLESFTVPGQGHAPLLTDKPTISAIRRFLTSADAVALRPARAG